MRRSLSFGRAALSRRRSVSVWFGAPLAAQQLKTDAGRQVPALLAELRSALLAQGGLAHADALFERVGEGEAIAKLRDRLEAGEAVGSVVRAASAGSLVALLHAWLDALPGGLCASAQQEMELLLRDEPRDFSPPALLQALAPDAREVLLWLLDLLSEAARLRGTPSPSSPSDALASLASAFGPRLLAPPRGADAPPRHAASLLLHLLLWRGAVASHASPEPFPPEVPLDARRLLATATPPPPPRLASPRASPRRALSFNIRGRWRAIDGEPRPPPRRSPAKRAASAAAAAASPPPLPAPSAPSPPPPTPPTLPSASSSASSSGGVWFGVPLARQPSAADPRGGGRRAPLLLLALREAMAAAGGAPLAARAAQPHGLLAARRKLEAGDAPHLALSDASAACLAQLLIDWFDALPDDLFASCRPTLEQLMLATSPPDEHAELFLLTKLPSRERELVLWTLHLLHDATLDAAPASALTPTFRQLANGLILAQKGGSSQPSSSEHDLTFGYQATRFLERLVHAYSLLVIDSLLAPPALALLLESYPLELRLLLPARTPRDQLLSHLADTALDLCARGSGHAALRLRHLPLPSSHDELTQTLRRGGRGEAAAGEAAEGRALLAALQSRQAALLRFGEEVLLHRVELRLSLEWAAELAWQRRFLVQTHVEAAGVARQACGEVVLPVRHDEPLGEALWRGLRAMGIERDEVHVGPRFEREILRVEYEDEYPDLPVLRATRAVHAVLTSSAAASLMQPSFSRDVKLIGGATRRVWFSWFHPAELAAASHSRVCLAAEESRRAAAPHEWARLLRRAPAATPPRAACVCVGRPDEGLSAPLEAALAEACARLASHDPLFASLALAKYRAVAPLPQGGRLLALQCVGADGAALPPLFCRCAADGAPRRAAPPHGRGGVQLAQVLSSRIPRPLDAPLGASLAAAASAGAGAAAAAAAGGAELFALGGGCWEAAELAGADARLANTLAELLAHESAQCRVRAAAARAAESQADAECEVFGDAALLLDEILGGALQQLQQRSLVLTKCSLFEYYQLQPRLRALLASATPEERDSLDAACAGLLASLAAVPPCWPLPAGAKGCASLQHGSLQAAHVLVDARGAYWLLPPHRPRAGPALHDAATLLASALFLATSLPLCRDDLLAPPPRRLAAQLRLSEADARAVQAAAARCADAAALPAALAAAPLSAAAAARVAAALGTPAERRESLREACLLSDWIASLPPFGGHVYAAPPPVSLPHLRLAFSYVQQVWGAAAALCCLPGGEAAAEEAWRHPAQLVVPLLAYAARMASFAEATAPQRQWMVYTVARLADALRGRIERAAPLPTRWDGVAPSLRDIYGGAQTRCPYAPGQRLLVRRDQSWEEAEVGPGGASLLLDGSPSPLPLDPLLHDYWVAPPPYAYAADTPLLLLVGGGWEEWRVASRAAGGNAFTLRRGAATLRLLLTPFNHRAADGAFPPPPAAAFARGALLRLLTPDGWCRGRALGGTPAAARLSLRRVWVDRPLRAFAAAAPLLHDGADLAAEAAKHAARLAAAPPPPPLAAPAPPRAFATPGGAPALLSRLRAGGRLLLVGEAGSGKSALCATLLSLAARDGGAPPLLVAAADVAAAAAAAGGARGGSLLLAYLRGTHGARSRAFAFYKQALLERRLLLLLDGLALPSPHHPPPLAAAMAALHDEAATLLACAGPILITARPAAVHPHAFPPPLFLTLPLRAHPPSLRAAAAAAALLPSQRAALAASPLPTPTPFLAALLVAVHAVRSPRAPPLTPLAFLLDALRLMLRHAAAAAPRPPPRGAAGGGVAVRLHVLQRLALLRLERREEALPPLAVEEALRHSAGALEVWRQMCRESRAGQLPLLVDEGADGNAPADHFSFRAPFADLLLALALREIPTSTLLRPATSLLLTAASERLKPAAAASASPAARAADWAWPEGGCSPLLCGGDALLLAEAHARPFFPSAAAWLRLLCDALAAPSLRAIGQPRVDPRLLAVPLRHARALLSLQLVHCSLDDAAAASLAAALAAAAAPLETLHLGANQIGPAGAAALCAALPPTLLRLGLEQNRVADDGAASFAALLRADGALCSLDLSANCIGDRGVLRLLHGLAGNQSLHRLYLCGNPCDPAQHAPALEPRHALLESDAAPVKERVVF
ncbi:hypothetical protein AB1Y20_016580 [Prymnesium parvum]|uniref:Rho-GAP domain-containing protein n=1 Tax=Prymnesium parvum TaxID=97485 RepID=A0AB34ID65_PRYPA